jgi:hypothetical protein
MSGKRKRHREPRPGPRERRVLDKTEDLEIRRIVRRAVRGEIRATVLG